MYIWFYYETIRKIINTNIYITLMINNSYYNLHVNLLHKINTLQNLIW